MTIFDILKDIIRDKTGDLCEDEEFGRAFSSFMICRYLSMDRRFVKQAEIANRLQTTMSPEQLYKLLVRIVPRYDRTFIHYISKSKNKKK